MVAFSFDLCQNCHFHLANGIFFHPWLKSFHGKITHVAIFQNSFPVCELACIVIILLCNPYCILNYENFEVYVLIHTHLLWNSLFLFLHGNRWMNRKCHIIDQYRVSYRCCENYTLSCHCIKGTLIIYTCVGHIIFNIKRNPYLCW